MKKRFLVACLVSFLSVFVSSPAMALEVSLDNARIVNDSGSRAFFTYVTNDSGGLSRPFSQSYVSLPTSHRGAFYLDAQLKNSANNYFYLEPNSIFVYYIMTDNMVWRSGGSSDSTTRNAGCKAVGNAGNWTTWECYAVNYDSTNTGYMYISNQWERAVSGYAMEFTFGSWTQYKSSDTDYTSILNSINFNTSTTASNISSLSSLVDALKTQTNNNFNRQHDDITALSDRMNRNFNMLDNSITQQGNATQEAIEAQTEQDQQDREDLSDQQSAADTSAADSGDDAEEAGTSLLSAVSSFVGVLTSASPSDCVIDMDLGNLDMGNVDLCQLSPPQPIPTIASIMLISFFVPLSWATATRMIGLFRSFTG